MHFLFKSRLRLPGAVDRIGHSRSMGYIILLLRLFVASKQLNPIIIKVMEIDGWRGFTAGIPDGSLRSSWRCDNYMYLKVGRAEQRNVFRENNNNVTCTLRQLELFVIQG